MDHIKISSSLSFFQEPAVAEHLSAMHLIVSSNEYAVRTWEQRIHQTIVLIPGIADLRPEDVALFAVALQDRISAWRDVPTAHVYGFSHIMCIKEERPTPFPPVEINLKELLHGLSI